MPLGVTQDVVCTIVTFSCLCLVSNWASLVAQMVKNLPAVQEIRVRFLGWEDPQEKENGHPLQYSCLENPLDRGAWQATVHRVAKSWTQLKRLSTRNMLTAPHSPTQKDSAQTKQGND